MEYFCDSEYLYTGNLTSVWSIVTECLGVGLYLQEPDPEIRSSDVACPSVVITPPPSPKVNHYYKQREFRNRFYGIIDGRITIVSLKVLDYLMM